MKKQNIELDKLLKLINALPQTEMDKLVEELYEKFSTYEKAADASVYSFNEENIYICRNCGSIHVVKNGKDRHGHTRYLCRDCHKTFGKVTNTVVAGTHKDSTTWKNYISSLLSCDTLKVSAQKCNISVPTAFVWRHKILTELSQTSFANAFDGLLEMDEMFVRISYKGNHKNSKHFTMPRPAFKRGSDNRIPSNNSKATVLCVVERNKGYFGLVPCKGTINLPLLAEIFDEKISDESIVLTDGLRAYNQYFENSSIGHVVLPTRGGKPTVKGPYHINTVNALHRRFRRFLGDYNGVSTKYLSNYLALFLWLENNRHYDKQKKIHENLIRTGSYVSANSFLSFPAEPELAPAV